jgi:hypothetical protein
MSGTQTGLHPELQALIAFLRDHRDVRARIPAPRDRTIVYSGGIQRESDLFRAWWMLARAKLQDPRRFDYVTLEERLKNLFVVQWGQTLYERAMAVATTLNQAGRSDQAMILWRILSGLYVQGATGRVRALILPATAIDMTQTVFNLTEVNVLLRPDVLANIDFDIQRLRDFKTYVQKGFAPVPLVVF